MIFRKTILVPIITAVFFTTVLLICGFIVATLGGLLPEVTAKETSSKDLFDELKVFTDVLALVQRDYVKDVDSKKLVEGSIKGMLSSLDPHSGYLDPEFYQDLQAQTKGEFGGLGIEITIRDGLLVVVAPMEGSPAEHAGMRAGDVIVKIEGDFAKELSLFDAVKKLRGPKGSPISVSVMRDNKPELINLRIVRDNIIVRSVKARYLGGQFSYIRINQFVEKTGEDLQKAITKVRKESGPNGIKGLILDLRNNPGGLLTQAIKVSDMFLSGGVIVYTDGRMDSQKQKYYAQANGTEPNYPIVVLVNEGSASASEIVAGSLKDHGRALILGTQTFGKGSVQTITGLPNGGALTLTTALYYTKSGRSIQALGVTPDVEMEEGPTEEAEETLEEIKKRNRRLKKLRRMRESDLPLAITNPSNNGDKGLKKEQEEIERELSEAEKPVIINPETIEIKDWISKDPQFNRAYELIRTFNIFNRENKQV